MPGFNLCQYRDALGRPGEGLHSYRFLGVAVVDVALTALAAGLVSRYFNLNYWYTLAGAFAVGIVAHRAFCVRTTIDRLIFP